MKKKNEKLIKDKIIKVSVYFNTTCRDTTNGKGVSNLPLKECRDSGWVELPTNRKHNIRASDSTLEYFGDNQGDISSAIYKALKKYGVKVIKGKHLTKRLKILTEIQDLYR